MVYISKLKKNIFPAFIPPEQDELFSSWYCRLSISHAVKPLTFVKNNFGYDAPIFNRDIDCLKPDYLVKLLQQHTPLSKKRIDNLFINSYKDIYFNEFSNIKSSILSLGMNHRNRKRFGTMCCPKCLSNNPYYRKEWRLFTTIVCSKCKSNLIDRCPSCKKPISYHQIYNSGNQSTPDIKRPFSICWNCKIDFTQIEIIKPTSLEIQYQIFLNNTLKDGFNQFSNYSFLFVNGLILLSRSARGTKLNKFNKNLSSLLLEIYNIDFKQIKNETGSWSLDERKETLPVIYNFMRELPHHDKSLEYFKLSKSYLTTYNKNIEYWIISLLNL